MQHPPIRGLSEWRPLARGGLAMVWQARQPALDRSVAVKVYQRALDDDDRRRFSEDVAAVRSLSDHPGIVSVLDAGILPDGRPYVIMEFCPGGSLSRWLEPENRPSPERVRQVGVLIADAVATAHARGVLHRNLQPATILIDSSGNPGVSGFGLLAVAGPKEAATRALNTTPGYAPPEGLRMQPATESGDVFSLGATLYALSTGGPPPRVDAASGHEPTVEMDESPGAPASDIDQRLMSVMMTALSSDPTVRPTAAEFRDQLAGLARPATADHGPTIASADPQTPVLTAYEQPSRRHGKSRLAVLVLAAVLVTVVGSAMAWLMNKPVSSGVSAATGQTAATPDELPSSASPSATSDRSTPTPTATQEDDDADSAPANTIALDDLADSAKAFEAVRISGTFHGGPGRFVRVQRADNDRWQSFPIPAKTDQSGRFTTYVELGQPGRYRLRILDPDSGVTSKSFVLVITS